MQKCFEINDPSTQAQEQHKGAVGEMTILSITRYLIRVAIFYFMMCMMWVSYRDLTEDIRPRLERFMLVTIALAALIVQLILLA